MVLASQASVLVVLPLLFMRYNRGMKMTTHQSHAKHLKGNRSLCTAYPLKSSI